MNLFKKDDSSGVHRPREKSLRDLIVQVVIEAHALGEELFQVTIDVLSPTGVDMAKMGSKWGESA